MDVDASEADISGWALDSDREFHRDELCHLSECLRSAIRSALDLDIDSEEIAQLLGINEMVKTLADAASKKD